jgi:DNA-binding transcriptional LysR family regulator
MRSVGPKTDHPLSWDDLRTALFLARSGSIRKAARTLGVSHSTVLRRIADLERQSGVRLFDKKPDGYELTVAGQDVFDSARGVEEIVSALERRVHGRDLQLSGPVRVTMPDPFIPFFVPIMRAFRKKYPAIELTITVFTGYADLAQREADLAIRTAAEPPPDLVGRRVATAGIGIYGHQSYLRGKKTADIMALDWVGWERGSDMSFAHWITKNVPDERVVIRLSQSWAVGAAVNAGAGITSWPCIQGEVMPGWRRIRLMPEISAPMWILSHRDLRTTARVRVLRDFLADAVTKQRRIIEGK